MVYLLAQSGVSTAVTQRLFEHSSLNLTNKMHTNADSVLRQSVDQMPIEHGYINEINSYLVVSYQDLTFFFNSISSASTSALVASCSVSVVIVAC